MDLPRTILQASSDKARRRGVQQPKGCLVVAVGHGWMRPVGTKRISCMEKGPWQGFSGQQRGVKAVKKEMAQIGANKLPDTDLLMFALVQEQGEGLNLKPRFP